MTKKHFIALANHIRALRGTQNEPSMATIQMLADFCQSQNPRFNRERWVDYILGLCGPNGGRVPF